MENLLLVDINNRNINKALRFLYIREDFSNLLKNYLSTLNLELDYINMSSIGLEVIRVLYLILVDNVYRYLATNNVNLLLSLISNHLIRNDISIKFFYLSIFIDFLRTNYHINEFSGDIDLEFETKWFLDNVISLIFDNSNNNIYEGLVDILNSLMQNVTIYDETALILDHQDKILLFVKRC